MWREFQREGAATEKAQVRSLVLWVLSVFIHGPKATGRRVVEEVREVGRGQIIYHSIGGE